MTEAKNPVVEMKTNLGSVTIELWADKAPKTAENFLAYVDEKFFDGTIFHRIISNFMIQGGGFTPDMQQKRTHSPIRNEARSDVGNKRGTIAMARTSDINSATAQFFINVVDNDFLTHKNDSPAGFGYAVFGAVTSGMEVVDAIKAVRTTSRHGMQDVPVDPVVIEEIRRV